MVFGMWDLRGKKCEIWDLEGKIIWDLWQIFGS